MQIAVDPSKGYFMNEDEISALDELKHFSRQLSESHKDDKKLTQRMRERLLLDFNLSRKVSRCN